MNYTTAIVQLPLVRETAKEKIVTPENVYRACADIATLAQECFQILALNAKNALINRHLITLGLVDASLISAKELFIAAIQDLAASVVLVHNHPSGETAPSAEDLKITRQLVAAGDILGIKVLDHVIIGRPSKPTDGQPGRPAFLSLRESGLCLFS